MQGRFDWQEAHGFASLDQLLFDSQMLIRCYLTRASAAASERSGRLDAFVGRDIGQRFGLLGNNIGVLDLYSRYDAPKRISNSRSSYTFTKKSNAGANRMSTQSTNSTD